VELSVNAILAAIDDFQKEAGARAYRTFAGLDGPVARVDTFATLADVTRDETVAFVRELSTSNRIDAVKKARVERLLAFLLRLSAEARLARADDAIDTHLREKTLVAGGRTWTLREALLDAWALSTTEARALVSIERGAALSDAQALFERRAEVLAASAPSVGLASAVAWLEAGARRSFAEVEPRADELVRTSDDAARDLTGWAFKKVDPTLKPGTARPTDLERALAAPWFFELLRQEELTHAVTRMLGDLGLHPSAHGRLLVDTDPRPLRARAALVPLEVPDELRLVLTPAPGFEAWEGWLGAWGEGQFHAAVPRTLPFIDRVIGDGSLALAVRRLHESVLLDEGWLKRAVRATSAQARELARTFAWRQVMAIRREAAALSVTREVASAGFGRAQIESALAAAERAAFVAPERGRAWLDVDVRASALSSLEAWALEAHLVHVLRERFNEDWWRNPAAGRFLQGLAGSGATETAAQVGASLGRPTLDPVDAVRRRVVVMGA
jgi:hypothetical protein